MAVHQQSVISIISNAVSPVTRRLSNLAVDLGGTKVLLIRTRTTVVDEWEETEQALDTYVIDNAVLAYPNQNVRISSEINDDSNNQLNALSIMELLPVKMRVKFKEEIETIAENSVNAKVSDLIIDIKLDEFGKKAPIILKVSKIGGYFFEKNLVGLEFQLTRQTGILETDIGSQIEEFVDNY